MSDLPSTKLIEVPASLRLSVPADMSEEDIKTIVSGLTRGDFPVVYPEDIKSLKDEVIDHIGASDDYSDKMKKLTDQISEVDLWSNSSSFSVDLL